jgi:hypothetical protein
LGYGARVHVDPTKTAVAVQQHRFRGGLWIGGAILPLVLGIGGLAFVLVTLFDPQNPVHRSGDYALLACCGFFGFVMPFVAAGGAFLAALREMRRGEGDRGAARVHARGAQCSTARGSCRSSARRARTAR